MSDFHDELKRRAGLIALVISIVTMALFACAFLSFAPRYGFDDLNLFPEHINYFEIENPSGQKIAYFLAAFFALAVTASFFTPVWDKLNLKSPQSPATPNLLNRFEKNAKWQRYQAWLSQARLDQGLYVAIFIALAFVGCFLATYIPSIRLSLADPHIYYVSQELGQAIFRGSSITPNMMTAYGTGQSLIYALSLNVFGEHGYLSHVVLGKVFNLCLVSTFLWLCYKVSIAKGARHFSVFLMFFAFLVTSTLFGFANNGFEIVSNLSALRYVPLIFILAVFLTFDQATSFMRNVINISIASALAVLFPDTGTFCLLALLCFVLTDKKLDLSAIPRAMIYVLIMVAVAFLTALLVRTLFNVDILAFYFEMAERFGKNYGGVKLELSALTLFIPFVVLLSFFYFAFQAFQRNLTGVERIGLALSACFILMLMYYINRPSNKYWVFGMLMVIPAHIILNDIFKLAELRLKLTAFILVYLTLFSVGYEQFEFAGASVKRSEYFSRTSTVLGVNVRSQFAGVFNERLSELADITVSRKDSMVFSTTPTAVDSIKWLRHPPQELVFKNNNQDALEMTLDHIQKASPKFLIFENEWKLGYAWPVASQVQKRIFERIDTNYAMVCKHPFWLVYVKTGEGNSAQCPQ